MNKNYDAGYIIFSIILFYVLLIVFAAVYGDTGMRRYEVDKTRPVIDRGIMLDYEIMKIRMKHVDLIKKDTFLMPESVKRKIQFEVDSYRHWLIRGKHLRQRRNIR